MSFDQIFRLPKSKRLAQYEKIVGEMVKRKDPEEMIKFTDHLLNKEGTDQYGRTYITPKILEMLLNYLGKTGEDDEDRMDLEDLLPLMKQIVPKIREKGEDFPDALMNAIFLLYQLHMAEDEFKEAAHILTSFKFNQYRAQGASPNKQVDWHVNTTECWLEINETGSASQSIKKAQALLKQIKDQALIVRFRTCYARVLDADRKFLEAARAYQSLAKDAQGIMHQENIITTLGKAVKCAILAQAGPARSRVLAMLFADKRTEHLMEFSLLEKMFKGQIVRSEEVEAFEKGLEEHQKALMANGRTVLQNSIVAHNLFAASNIYNNILFEELGALLGISSAKSEELARDLIEKGSLKGVIDQIKGVVVFYSDEVSAGTLSVWDHQIENLCLGVNSVLENIVSKHPGNKKYTY